jgi:hypothetical protein
MSEVGLFDKINTLIEAKKWTSFKELPDYVQYAVMNVVGGGLMESISPEQYLEEHPDWAKAINESYDAVIAERAEQARIKEATDKALADGVKFIAGLSADKIERLKKLLEGGQESTSATS